MLIYLVIFGKCSVANATKHYGNLIPIIFCWDWQQISCTESYINQYLLSTGTLIDNGHHLTNKYKKYLIITFN